MSVIKTLFLTWQDADTRRWYPVGKLDFDGMLYTFAYTQGAEEASKFGFKPFARMEEMNAVYQSTDLFPLFANRVLPKSRPDYQEYAKWFGISESDGVMEWLSKSGGRKATDSLGLFSCPIREEGKPFSMNFFIHGIRYLPKESQDMILSLNKGDQLLLMKDFQNEYDSSALAVRSEDPRILIGYCPRYFSSCFLKLLEANNDDVSVSVEQVNSGAPYQYQLLCHVEAKWPEGLSFFTEQEFSPRDPVLAKAIASISG